MKRAQLIFDKVKPWLGVFLLCLMLWLLARQLTGVNWRDVSASVAAIPWYVIASMIAGTAVSYMIYSYYDVRSVKTLHKKASNTTLFVPAFVSYVANFNFGGIIGAVGMRVKLYTDLGLSAGQIGGVVALSTLGNWLGYLCFGGLLLSLRPPTFTANEYLVGMPWRGIGFGMLTLLGLVFVVLYKVGPREVKRFRFQIPGAREGLIRSMLAVANWASVSAVLMCIFSWHFKVPMQAVLASYIVSAVAGALIHVPGGVGVFETVFLAGLREFLPVESILAGLLAFRALYYLAPLAVAVPCSIWFHFHVAGGNAPGFGSPVEDTA